MKRRKIKDKRLCNAGNSPRRYLKRQVESLKLCRGPGTARETIWFRTSFTFQKCTICQTHGDSGAFCVQPSALRLQSRSLTVRSLFLNPYSIAIFLLPKPFQVFTHLFFTRILSRFIKHCSAQLLGQKLLVCKIILIAM